MEQAPQDLDLRNLKRIIRRRKWWLILPAFCVTLLAGFIALVLPNEYKSSAVVLIENQQIPPNLVASTVTSYAEQRIQAITQEINSRSRILGLVEKYDLLPNERKKLTTEDVVDKIRKAISIEPINAEIRKDSRTPQALTIAFTLSYSDRDPKKAQLVTNEITSYYLEKNLESRERHARGTTEFLQEQLDQVKSEIQALESRLAQYRQAHMESLPEYTSLNMQKLEKITSDIGNLNMQIRSLEEQRTGIRNRLSQIAPYAGSSERVLSPEERLQQARIERAELVAKYSDKHPLILAKNREIALLEEGLRHTTELARLQERLTELERQLADERARYTDAHPSVHNTLRQIEELKAELETLRAQAAQQTAPPSTDEGATNPAYVALKSDLEKTEISIASLSAEKARLEEQARLLSQKLHAMPQIAIEYNQLSTDYEIAKARYNEIQQKLMTAQVSQGMEEERLGETFEIVEPAFFPEKPYKPNRLAILLMGMVLGLGLSVGLTSIREYTDDRIHDSRSLERAAGCPVLSVIPRILTEEDRRRTRGRKTAAAAAALVASVAAVAAFHFFVMDLVVFYVKVLNLLRARLTL